MSFKKTTSSNLTCSFCTDEELTGTDDQENRAAPFDTIREEIQQITPVIVDEGPVAKKSKPYTNIYIYMLIYYNQGYQIRYLLFDYSTELVLPSNGRFILFNNV